MATDALDRILSPRGVAIVGASSRPGALSTRFVSGLQRHGYGGAIVPVNPKAEEICGLACAPSIEDACARAAIDLAVVSLPGAAVESAITECGEAGIAGAIIFSSGFAETGPAGRLAQEHLAEVARRARVRLLGPNSPGFVNLASGVCVIASGLSFRPTFEPGPVGLVVQSGGIAGLLAERAQDAGLGLSSVVCTGNEADLTAAEILAWMATDDATRVAALFLEGIRSPEALVAAFEAMGRARKPVICLKAGSSGVGARATAAHTGALATDDDVLDAVFRRHGVVRVFSVDDLIDTARVLSELGPSPRSAVGIVTTSGGAGVIAAEAAERAGIELPELPPSTAEELARVLPSFASANNPADMSGMFVEDPAIFAGCLSAFERSAEFAAVVLVLTVHPPEFADALAARLLAERERAGWAPVVLWIAGAMSAPARARLRAGGILVFEDADRCMRALSARRVPATEQRPSAEVLGVGVAGAFNSEDPLAVARAIGIATVENRRCSSEADVLDALRGFGGRVVVKADAPSLAHKSDVGCVVLGVEGEDEAAEAHREVVRAARAAGVEPVGSVVQPMAEPGTELIIGVRRDRDFGPVLVVGAGGTLTELVSDAATRLLPLARGEAAEMLASLRVFKVLEGFRGSRPGDVDAAVAAIEALGELGAALHRDRADFESFEVNPLIVHDRGKGVTAVDALLLLGGEGKRPG